MSLFVLPRLDASYLADEAWGSTSLSAVGGVWAVVTALAAAIVVLDRGQLLGVCLARAKAWTPASMRPLCRC